MSHQGTSYLYKVQYLPRQTETETEAASRKPQAEHPEILEIHQFARHLAFPICVS